MDAISFLLMTLTISVPIFLVAFFFARRWNFYSLVDCVWPYTFTVVAGISIWKKFGLSIEFFILAMLMGIWGIRLGTHVLTRILKHYPHEDRRYAELKERKQGQVEKFFFFFFMFQSVSVAILITPLAIAAQGVSRVPSPWFWVGIITWFIGLAGEWLSDEQLKNFLSDLKNKGQVCESGFWYYSRHPNYFFEWLMWVSYAFLVVGLQGWYWAWLSPLIMLLLLTKGTGVPYAEKMSLKSKGDLYRRYQKTTSVFVPWFKKKIN